MRVPSESMVPHKKRASGSVVEYRLAKARVAGSNPVLRSKKRTGQYHRYCPVFFVSASAHVPEVRSLRFAPVRPKPASTGCRGPRLAPYSSQVYKAQALTPRGSKSRLPARSALNGLHRRPAPRLAPYSSQVYIAQALTSPRFEVSMARFL